MKLFLSSYRAGNHNADLIKFLGDIKKVAFISNAKDYKSKSEREKSMRENFNFWKSNGIEPHEIDLRSYFRKKGAEKLFDGFDFVWLAGGNAFLLRRALKYSGIDKFLKEKVGASKIVYGGESAGAILAAPTLRGSEDGTSSGHEDDPNYSPEPYEKKVFWDGLGFLDFVLVPHYKSPEIAESIDGYVDYLKAHRIPHKTIREEEALIIDGKKREFLK